MLILSSLFIAIQFRFVSKGFFSLFTTKILPKMSRAKIWNITNYRGYFRVFWEPMVKS